jgi:hypothetical protein
MLHPEESLNILKKHVPSFPEALVGSVPDGTGYLKE